MKSFIFLMVIGLVLGVSEVKGQLRLVGEFEFDGRVDYFCPSEDFPYYEYVAISNRVQDSSGMYWERSKLQFKNEQQSITFDEQMFYMKKDMMITIGSYNQDEYTKALKKYKIEDSKANVVDSVSGLDYESGVKAFDTNKGLIVYREGNENYDEWVVIYNEKLESLVYYTPFGNEYFDVGRMAIGDSIVVLTGSKIGESNITLYNFISDSIVASNTIAKHCQFGLNAIYEDYILINKFDKDTKESKLECLDMSLMHKWSTPSIMPRGITIDDKNKELIMVYPNKIIVIDILTGNVVYEYELIEEIRKNNYAVSGNQFFFDNNSKPLPVYKNTLYGLIGNPDTANHKMNFLLFTIKDGDVSIADLNLPKVHNHEKVSISIYQNNLYLVMYNELSVYEID